MSKHQQKSYYIATVLLGLICIFMHIYCLGSIPYGIHCDEMGMGYDAWCLANFGIDRYQNSFPVYLINFSGGQSALYAYLCMPFVKLFGFTTWAFRAPIAIFALITVFFAWKLTSLIWPKQKWMKVIVLGIYTICPVFTMLHRIGLDCNLMLGMGTVFLYLLVKAINTGTARAYIKAGIVAGVLLYTYVLSHVALPIFLVCVIAYLLAIRKITWKQILLFGIPLFLLAVPLLLFHYINKFDLEELHIGFITIPKLYRYRSDDMSFQGILKNIKGFFYGTLVYDGIAFNSIRKFQTMYVISIPFIFGGMLHAFWRAIRSIKQKEFEPLAVIACWMIGLYCTGILLATAEDSIVYRMNAIYIAYLFFCVDGLFVAYSFLKNYIGRKIQYVSCIMAIIYGCFFVCFAKYYFIDYTKDTYLIDYFNFTFEDVLQYIEEKNPDDFSERVTYICDVGFSYIYYLASAGLSPYEYNQLADDEPYTLYLWMESYKNYRMSFPEKVDPAGFYIVPETSKKYIQILEEYGMDKVSIGTYYLFWNPWLEYDGENSEALISWDHGMTEDKVILDDGENTVLSGWSIDMSCGKVWDDIIVKVKNQYYTAEKMERKDVADSIGNQDLAQCGVHVTMPTEEVSKAGEVTVFFINYDEKSCYRKNYRVYETK